MNAGPAGTNGGLAANRLAHDADVVDLRRDPDGRLRDGLADDVPEPRRDVHRHQRRRRWTPTSCARSRSSRTRARRSRALDGAARRPPATPAPRRRTGERVADLKREWDGIVDGLRAHDDAPGDLGQAEVIGIVNDAVGGHATVICAAGSLPGDLLRLWRPEDPKAYHVEYGFSCMGYEIVAGLGVRLADPDRDVVVMVGDGSYLMMNSEIVTAVAEGLKLTIVVLDNHGFQCILALQRLVGVPDFGNELRFRDPPAQPADRAVRPGRLPGARRGDGRAGDPRLHARTSCAPRSPQARTADRITVIVVPTEPEKRMPGFESWWDVPVAGASGQDVRPQRPQRLRQEAPRAADRHPVTPARAPSRHAGHVRIARRHPCPDPGSSSSARKRPPR